MGIDYNAFYGIGFEVIFDESLEDCGQKAGYLEEVLYGSPYKFIEIGDEGYSDDPNTFYVILDNDTLFDDGYNLSEKITELVKFLNANNIKTEEKPAGIGGIWWDLYQLANI